MPAAHSRPRTVVVLAAPGTLAGLVRGLRRRGVRAVRVPALETRLERPATWLRPLLRRDPPDTVIVTSRVGVSAGVRPWARAVRGSLGGVEFWAVGPETAQALRSAGVARIRRPRAVGSTALARALDRSPHRRIVYFRSDRAGPQLAGQLRREGHVVLDRVVYRVGRARRWTGTERAALLSADLLVAASPSGLRELRRQLGQARFSRLADRHRLIVLGDRSRRVAVEYGFRYVVVVSPATTQRFTQRLLRELRHAIE